MGFPQPPLAPDDILPGQALRLNSEGNGWEAFTPGGGGGAGSVIVRKFPFAFDTPNILTGAALYTPTVGDILLDAWIEIDTAWNGTTPHGDMGSFVSNNHGVFGQAAGTGVGLNMTEIDGPNTGLIGSTIAGQQLSSLADVSALNVAVGLALTTSGLNPVALAYDTVGTLDYGSRDRPVKFISTDPIKVCVSQDGTNTGADPGSTQGAAILYLVTATPV